MTKNLNPDRSVPQDAYLPFAPGEIDASGLRLTRAEFARFLGVSKQTVSEWVQSGKVVLGADGRLDPRKAVAQLLRNSDPARLRSRVLAPLTRDVAVMEKRVADLERALARARDDAKLYGATSRELSVLFASLNEHLRNERETLCKQAPAKLIDAITRWLSVCTAEGHDPRLTRLADVMLFIECEALINDSVMPDFGADDVDGVEHPRK